ncbi:myelin-oligodendrocyte glycoprotein [Chanos chanos]|uniref:Myelin-oligodendrocyte glycoprotein n=1 Tax=Chanos chanos TaxID=29144 RepID=A0A6J2VT22_CHACN|nr:myelin-oligodendrocyte glycoprotein-like [Chanos chanos]
MVSLPVILLFLLGTTVSRSEIQVVGPAHPRVALTGEDVVLPCGLKPGVSAEAMTVQWSRGQSLVHLYQDGGDKNEQQLQSYGGRTTLSKEELQKGIASLKLSSVRISDEGSYTCSIRSDTWSGEITVQLSVIGATGTLKAGQTDGVGASVMEAGVTTTSKAVQTWCIVIGVVVSLIGITIALQGCYTVQEPQKSEAHRDECVALREGGTPNGESILYPEHALALPQNLVFKLSSLEIQNSVN